MGGGRLAPTIRIFIFPLWFSVFLYFCGGVRAEALRDKTRFWCVSENRTKTELKGTKPLLPVGFAVDADIDVLVGGDTLSGEIANHAVGIFD